MKKLWRFLVILTLAPLGWLAMAATVERFPPPDFGPGYVYPNSSFAVGRATWMAWVDVGVLLLALGLAAWIAHRVRKRRAMILLSIGSLLYFGFYRLGCVCPIGSIQNVSQGIFNRDYVVPLPVLAFFALPLLFALVFGRVFCGGVCPLGALQDLVLVRATKLPRWLDHGLGLMRWVYLGLAVLLAATASGYIICEYDPFVGFFRMSARFHIWVWSGVMLALSVFIGRPYCRFLCPYSVLLSLFSRFGFRKVAITPSRCITCHLCRESCPFNAINPANRPRKEPAA